MDDAPDHSIYKDKQGVTVVVVGEEHLSNFKLFVRWVVKEKIGLEVGAFKVVLHESVKRTDNVERLITALKKYFKTKRRGSKGGWAYPKPDAQHIFRHQNYEHVYGCVKGIGKMTCSESDATKFFEELRNPLNFLNQSNCCTDALHSSEEEFIEHYWSEVHKHSKESIEDSEVIVNTLLEEANHLRRGYVHETDMVPANCVESSSIKNEQKEDHSPILYSAGISIPKTVLFICAAFSLAMLGTILDLLPKKCPGLSWPYFYVGLLHSSFAWHIEDIALFSINYLHYGAPKVWFVIPPKAYKRFTEVVALFPLDLGHITCSRVLGHKYILASKEFLQKFGIPVYTIVQQEGEIIITLCYGAHSGFSMIWNIAEAANFGDPSWVEIACLAPPICTCDPNQLHMDMKQMIAVARPHLLNLYVKRDFMGLSAALKDNEILQLLGCVPPYLNQNADEEGGNEDNHEQSVQALPESVSAVVDDVKGVFRGARADIFCPECSRKFVGGRSKLFRVHNHAKEQHSDKYEVLKDLIDQQNPPKLSCGWGFVCNLCGVWKKGSISNLKKHHKRVHKKKPFCRPSDCPVSPK